MPATCIQQGGQPVAFFDQSSVMRACQTSLPYILYGGGGAGREEACRIVVREGREGGINAAHLFGSENNPSDGCLRPVVCDKHGARHQRYLTRGVLCRGRRLDGCSSPCEQTA